MKTKISKYKASLLRTILLGIFSIILIPVNKCKAQSQFVFFQQAYFQNRYAVNPSMAGIDGGLNVNLGYRQQWSSFPGTPKTQLLTVDYAATDRVGLGLNLSNNAAGLLNQTRVMGTYAYHLPLGGDEQKLSFGLSVGLSDPYVNTNIINGSQSDVEIANYNQLGIYADGDFGMSYTDKQLTIQGVLPNLKTAFFGNNDDRIDVDRLVFLTSASYKIFPDGNDSKMVWEPIATFRKVKGFDNFIDAGCKLSMPYSNIYAQAIYSNDQTFSVGMGLAEKAFGFNLAYSLQTGTISAYSAGTFEFGVSWKLKGAKRNAFSQ